MANPLIEILVKLKDEASAGFKVLQAQVEETEGSVFSLKGLIQAVAATEIVSGLVKLVEAFGAEEQAITNLNAALRVTGRFTEEGSLSIQHMADSMQDLTTTGRLAAVQVSATVAQLATQLSTDQLAQVQKAAIGLADAFGIDLNRAAVLITKSLEGSTNALQRYGISVDVTADQQTRFNQLMEQLDPLFQISIERAKTFSGMWEQAKNAMADTTRLLGELIIRILGLETSGRSLRDVVVDLNNWIKENAGEFVKWGGVVMDALRIAVSGFELLFTHIFSNLKAVAVAFGELIAAVVETLRGNFDAAADHATAAQDAILNAMTGMAHSITLKIKEIKDEWAKMVKDINANPPHVTLGAENAGAGANINPQPMEDINSHITQLVGTLKSMNEQFQAGSVTAQKFVTDGIQVRNMLMQMTQAAGVHGKQMLQANTELHAFDVELGKAAASIVAGTVDLERWTTFWSLFNQLSPSAQAEALSKAATDLVAEFKAGTITFEEFFAKSNDVRTSLQGLVTSGKLTADQVKALELALTQLDNTAVGGVNEEIKNLNEQFATGAVGLAEYHKQVDILIQKLLLLKAAAGGNVTELTAILAALNKLGVTKSLGEGLKEAFLGVKDPVDQAKTSIDAMATSLETAFVQGVEAAISAHKGFGEAIKEAVGKAAAAEAGHAFALSILEAAEALGSLAIGDGPGAAKHAAASEMYLVAAAALGALGAAGGGFNGGGGAGGASNAQQQTNAVQATAQQEVTINVPNTFTSDPAFWDALLGGLEQAGLKRITVTGQG